MPEGTIEWENLRIHKGTQHKAFEELCYLIAKNEFESEGKFTPVDDSGGGDGVEFYLTLPNGDVWGWQSKYFGRLDEGGRKEQIKTSLRRAHSVHPNLKKWFLCTKANFTPDERSWFEDTLSSATLQGSPVLPASHEVELLHWGESEFVGFIEKYPDIGRFFFNARLLGWEWFQERYERILQTTQIKSKYEADLHIDSEADSKVIQILGGSKLIGLLEQAEADSQIEQYVNQFNESVSELFSSDVDPEYQHIQEEFRSFVLDKTEILNSGFTKLLEIKDLLRGEDDITLKDRIVSFKAYIEELNNFYAAYRELADSDLCKPLRWVVYESPEPSVDTPTQIELILKKINKFLGKKPVPVRRTADVEEPEEIKTENKKRSKNRSLLHSPYYDLKEYAIPAFEQTFRVLDFLYENQLHFSGDAGMGKTHLSFNILEQQIEANLPGIFLFARDFSTQDLIETQIKNNARLGLPTDWSFEDFLGALDTAARVYKTKLPLIIDGLNEAEFWQDIWLEGIERISILIATKYKNLVLITTYRTSYEAALFPDSAFRYEDDTWKRRARVHGFRDTSEEAIDRYFDYYKITVRNRSAALAEFKHPLYLKLFCETKNPSRAEDIEVSFQHEDLFDVFDQYLNNSNTSITSALQGLDPRYNAAFVSEKLNILSKYLWEHNVRGMPQNLNVFTADELRLFESENLLIYRDWNSNREEIVFTYDLLGGYVISKYLVNALGKGDIKTKLARILNPYLSSLQAFVKSSLFKNKFLGADKHPLYHDVLRCFSILLAKGEGKFLFQLLNDEITNDYSIGTIFEINPTFVASNEAVVKDFLRKEFSDRRKRDRLLDLSINITYDPNHPLNFNFWSENLQSLSMPERDISWGNYIRDRHPSYGGKYFVNFLSNFEEASREGRANPDRLYLAAKKALWVLTTNVRDLRDLATRSLYYYARQDPDRYLTLLSFSFEINDPYVQERAVAAAFGMVMARHNESGENAFRDQHLEPYADLLFGVIFSETATHPTTHFLTRLYAKGVIDIALIHNPNLLDEQQRELITYPFVNYPHSEWGESLERDRHLYKDGNAPIHMDFENYTIGRLVRDRQNYDRKHTAYRSILGSILWRIYDLGYTIQLFSQVDISIGRSNWDRSRYESEGSGHIDRFGKKYSWIAYYEMAGRLSDAGQLKGWDNEDQLRISDLGLDPSFPADLKKFDLTSRFSDDFLGNQEAPASEWYEDTSDTGLSHYLTTRLPFDDESSEWVLLHGVIARKDSDVQTRDTIITLNAVLVDESGLEALRTVVSNGNYEFGNLDLVSAYNLFEGEVPWSELMPSDYADEIHIWSKGSENRSGIDVSITKTVYESHWEGQHSEVIPGGQTITPSKTISNHLGLYLLPQTSDMNDPQHRLASTAFKFGERWDNESNFLYIRRDLMEGYLNDTNQSLVFVQWGEKRYFEGGVKNYGEGTREYRTISQIYFFE